MPGILTVSELVSVLSGFDPAAPVGTIGVSQSRNRSHVDKDDLKRIESVVGTRILLAKGDGKTPMVCLITQE